MKYFLIFLYIILQQEGISQTLLDSRQTSYYTYIYKLTEVEAKKIYKKDLWVVDQSYFHSLVDSIPTDSSYDIELPFGHYLKTYTEKNKLKFSITTIQDFDVQIVNNNTDLNIQVYDSAGNIIKNARVLALRKRLHFDEKSQSFRDRKSNRQGLLTVNVDGFSTYYRLDREYENSWIKRNSRKVLYGIPVKYVWKPVRFIIYLPIDGVKSISRGYTQGTIYRSKNFFEKAYHNVACIFDEYHCNFYYNNRFAQKHKGYLVFNKPKYLPQDTVKFKAFVVNKNGKPIKKELNVVVGDYHKYTKITSLKPFRDGAYAYEFYLNDSLELKLGGSYEVSLQVNDRKEFMSEYFRYEDYELSKIKLELSANSKGQYKGKSFAISAKGTDENDLNLLDAKVEVLVKFGDAFSFYDEHVFVGDTLLLLEKTLDVQKPTEFIIPDSIFPAADISYEAIVRMTTSDNELVTETLKVLYHHHDMKIDHTLHGDSLHLSFTIDDVEKAIAAKIYGVDNFGNKTIQKPTSLPASIMVNPYFSDYVVQNDSLSVTIPVAEELSLIQCLSERSKDSVHILIQNPRNITFNYFVYKKNKEQLRGFGKSFKTKFKTSSSQNYFVSIQYLWGGKIAEENYRIPYNSKELKINVTQPAIIYPGQKSNIEIEVVNKEGNPVPDVDLTAYSYTKKFNESAPEIANLGKPKKNKVIINNFRFESNQKDDHSEINLDYKTWKTLAGLDSIDYYQFIYPENKIYQFTHTPTDSISQFSPFVATWVCRGVPLSSKAL